jgi:hypothetical protein
MVYLYFGSPGDDVREIGVEDICGIFYDLDAPVSEPDFDCDAAAAALTNVVASIKRCRSSCVVKFRCAEE